MTQTEARLLRLFLRSGKPYQKVINNKSGRTHDAALKLLDAGLLRVVDTTERFDSSEITYELIINTESILSDRKPQIKPVTEH